jgi:DNA polymerase V
VTPSLKAYGIPGRARLFEVVQRVQQINAQRQAKAPGRAFSGASWDDTVLRTAPALALDYIVAPPQMARYMAVGTEIYKIYLKYVAPTDIFAYSIDEVFMDVTDYLPGSGLTPQQLAMKMILDVLHTTGITATAGIGTNLYLCKIAMDIGAKHTQPDNNGVRIAQLDERTYRRTLWTHRPLTDFWRVGQGYAKKLEAHGIFTMGDVARCSLQNEDLLYRLFGVNAELLIDHAWGWEPCTMADVKAYKPESNSLSSGQVLQCPYPADKTKLVVREMTDMLALELVDKGLVTDQLVLTIGYDIENLKDPAIRKGYRGPVTTDHYGRRVPKHAHGTANLARYTASTRMITEAVMELFDRIVDPVLLARRLTLTANHVIPEGNEPPEAIPRQMSLFVDDEALEQQQREEKASLERERSMQKTILSIKKKYGKNAILKGMNLEEGATAQSRNQQIGGHKA